MAYRSRDDVRDRHSGVVAVREGLVNVSALEDVEHSVDEVLPVHLRAPQLKEALEENNHGRNGHEPEEYRYRPTRQCHRNLPFRVILSILFAASAAAGTSLVATSSRTRLAS